LTGAIYRNFLEQSLLELLEDVLLCVCWRMGFMHSRVSAHFSMYVWEYQNAIFTAWWFGCGIPFFWLVCLPDLNPLYSFIWGISDVSSTRLQQIKMMMICSGSR
jgi:hypothetical protein